MNEIYNSAKKIKSIRGTQIGSSLHNQEDYGLKKVDVVYHKGNNSSEEADI